MTKWTDEQLRAIKDRDCDLLVAAAAGAGKTAVLVERIIQRIIYDKNPADIDNMLVVTFTNAAAAEMRERIALALDKAVEKEPDSKRLQKQLLLLPKAGITTIHSFCMDVLKNNYYKLDLAPDFRIADGTESLLLKIEALDELFEAQYDKGEDSFYKLLNSYSGNKDDNSLKEMVLETYNFVQSIPWPDKWLKNMTDCYQINEDFDFINTKWAKIILELVNLELYGCITTLKKALSIAGEGYGLEKCEAQLFYDIKNTERLIYHEGQNWDSVAMLFEDIKFETQKRPTKDGDMASYEILKASRKDAKEKIYKLRDEFFSCNESEIKGDLATLQPLIKYLCELVMKFDEVYSLAKKEKGVIDFNDLEHFSLKILTEADEQGNIAPSPVALSLRDKYEEIMIDEYQDSNMVQEVILSVISRRDIGKPNMFMVGDVKQSIYRFRQAKPELFLDKYSRYSDADDALDRKVMLYKNFRSKEEIITGVNFFFRQLMTEYIGEIDYGEKEFLNYGATFPEDKNQRGEANAIELHILDLSEKEVLTADIEEEKEEESIEKVDGEEEIEEDLEDIQGEARIIGRRIKELVGEGKEEAFRIYDKDLKAWRNADYKDIVVLLRTVKNWAETIEEELESMGVPVFADTGTGYFKRMEVQIILSLLQIIDNPLQDIPLIAVLKSPIGGFTSQELMDVRNIDKKASFYDALQLAVKDDGEISKKATAFISDLTLWREKALHMPTDELIWYLYNETGFLSYVGAMPGGHQRQANLHILFERAKQYEDTSFKGLFNFINFIEKLRVGSGDMGNAKILGEKDNVVRIMSIHKSKGLEFPIVILGGVGKAFNMQDTRKSMLLHQDLGFGTDLVDLKRRITYVTLPKTAIKHKIKRETLSEEMRILYVAMTRAKEKLIITGFDKNLVRSLSKWDEVLGFTMEKLPAYMVISGRRFLDWVGLALARHTNLRNIEASGSTGFKKAFPWKVRVWHKEELLKSIDVKDEALDIKALKGNLELNKGSGSFVGEISKRLDWFYPFRKATSLPVKLSVTELKRMKGEEEEYTKELFKRQYIKKPVFMEEERTISAAKRGSIMHYVMQHLDLTKIDSVESIKAQIEQLVIEEFITREQSKVVNAYNIYRFFNSDLGKRIRKADEVYREMPFNMEIKPEEVFSDKDYSDLDERILLQGVIDCYFIEDGKAILVDYKTDYVDGNEEELAYKRYKVQMDYYTKALERIGDKIVEEKYIYFLYSGNFVKL